MPQFSVEDIKRILKQCAGEPESVSLDDDIRDVPFTEMGYDSLARMEMAAKIEQEFQVVIPDDMMDELSTPSAVVRYVTPRLDAA